LSSTPPELRPDGRNPAGQIQQELSVTFDWRIFRHPSTAEAAPGRHQTHSQMHRQAHSPGPERPSNVQPKPSQTAACASLPIHLSKSRGPLPRGAPRRASGPSPRPVVSRRGGGLYGPPKSMSNTFFKVFFGFPPAGVSRQYRTHAQGDVRGRFD
jgi:hypothetical protein